MADIINAFTRKPFEAPVVPEAAPDEVKVCENSLRLAEDILERVKAGKLTHFAMVGIYEGNPMCCATATDDTTAVDLAIVNLAIVNLGIDRLKETVAAAVDQYCRGEPIAMPEPDDEDEDVMFEGEDHEDEPA